MKKKFFPIDFAERIELNQPKSMFLDCGVFSLLNKTHAAKSDDYFDTDEFYQYMDDYAKFVNKYDYMFDVFSNVDIIGNPILTYRNQKYLEKRCNKTPLPVVHFGASMDWIKKYLDKGYDYLALGGLVGVSRSMSEEVVTNWIDNCFETIADKNGMPRIKLHGFGLTSFRWMRRYPFYSVDSTSWTLTAGFGSIYVPLQKNGKWDFSKDPIQVKVTHDNKRTKTGHATDYENLPNAAKKLVHKWLDYIQVPFGDRHDKSDNSETRYGVSTHYLDRRCANVRYFESFRQSLPDWPWRFRVSHRPSFA